MTGQAGTLRVLFFASLRDEVGTAEISLPMDGVLALDGVLERLRRQLSSEAFAALTAENIRLALNQTLIKPPLECHPGDELAFLPPVTGG